MRKHHSGSALMSALFISALAAMIAIALAVSQRLIIHQTQLVIQGDQTHLDLQGIQIAAENEIKNYASQWGVNNGETVQLKPLPKILSAKKGDVKIDSTIENAQGRFNINELVYPENQLHFVALLKAVMPSITAEKSMAIAKAITASMVTIKKDTVIVNEMVSISELRDLISSDVYAALQPYIIALFVVAPTYQNVSSPTAEPPATPVDINSVSTPVLIANNPALTLQQAQSLLLCRDSYGVFENPQAFMMHCAQPAGIGTLNNLTVSNTYFLVHSRARYHGHAMSLTSLLMVSVSESVSGRKSENVSVIMSEGGTESG